MEVGDYYGPSNNVSQLHKKQYWQEKYHSNKNNNGTDSSRHNNEDSGMHRYQRRNYHSATNTSLNDKAAHGNEYRRQRHRQHEADCINNDDYSLDASKGSNRAKRTVESKANSCKEGFKVAHTVVDLMTNCKESNICNESLFEDGILNPAAVTNKVNHELLQDVYNIFHKFIGKEEGANIGETIQSAAPALLPNQGLTVVKERNSNKCVSRAKEKKPAGRQRTTEICPPVSFNDKPLFLLEEACVEYKTASNGKKFIVKHVQTKNRIILSIVVWEHDNRGQKQLIL